MYTEIGNFKINFINIGYTFGRNKERERGLEGEFGYPCHIQPKVKSKAKVEALK